MRDLSVCPKCAKDFVVPVDWEEASATMWTVVLRCGNCGRWEVGKFADRVVNKLEDKLEAGLDAIEAFLQELETDRFAEALAVDAILPEDF